MSEQYRQLPIKQLEQYIPETYTQSTFLIEQPEVTEEDLARQLEDKGLIFQRIPEDWYPGKPFTTPRELANSEASAYSQKHILYLMKRYSIGGIEIAGNKVLEVGDVMKLKELEDAPPVDGSNRGRPAGWREGIPARRDAFRNNS